MSNDATAYFLSCSCLRMHIYELRYMKCKLSPSYREPNTITWRSIDLAIQILSHHTDTSISIGVYYTLQNKLCMKSWQ